MGIKLFVCANKAVFLTALCCICIGFFAALAEDVGKYESSKNFIVIISYGDFSPLGTLLAIFLGTTLLFALVMAGGFHFIVSLAYFVGLIIGSKLLFKAAFISCALDGSAGYVYLFFFIIPIVLAGAGISAAAYAYVYDICGYSHSKLRRCNFAVHKKKIWDRVLRCYAVCLCFNLTLWLIIYAIAALAAG